MPTAGINLQHHINIEAIPFKIILHLQCNICAQLWFKSIDSWVRMFLLSKITHCIYIHDLIMMCWYPSEDYITWNKAIWHRDQYHRYLHVWFIQLFFDPRISAILFKLVSLHEKRRPWSLHRSIIGCNDRIRQWRDRCISTLRLLTWYTCLSRLSILFFYQYS